jgi:hypothetical protein
MFIILVITHNIGSQDQGNTSYLVSWNTFCNTSTNAKSIVRPNFIENCWMLESVDSSYTEKNNWSKWKICLVILTVLKMTNYFFLSWVSVLVKVSTKERPVTSTTFNRICCKWINNINIQRASYLYQITVAKNEDEGYLVVICSLEFNRSLDRYLCGGHRTKEILHIW